MFFKRENISRDVSPPIKYLVPKSFTLCGSRLGGRDIKDIVFYVLTMIVHFRPHNAGQKVKSSPHFTRFMHTLLSLSLIVFLDFSSCVLSCTVFCSWNEVQYVLCITFLDS